MTSTEMVEMAKLFGLWDALKETVSGGEAVTDAEAAAEMQSMFSDLVKEPE